MVYVFKVMRPLMSIRLKLILKFNKLFPIKIYAGSQVLNNFQTSEPGTSQGITTGRFNYKAIIVRLLFY